MNRISLVGAAAALAVLIAASAEAAKTDDPAGAKALHDYALSMDKVKRYKAATEAWQAAGSADPTLRTEGDKMTGEPDKTLGDVEAKFDRHPRIYAFFAKQGLSKLDAAALPIVLMDAGTVAQMPQIASKMTDRVSESQIAFLQGAYGRAEKHEISVRRRAIARVASTQLSFPRKREPRRVEF